MRRLRLNADAKLKRSRAKYWVVLRKALADERQMGTCPDGSRLGKKARLCSPIMGPSSGMCGWMAPQAIPHWALWGSLRTLMVKVLGGHKKRRHGSYPAFLRRCVVRDHNVEIDECFEHGAFPPPSGGS